MKIKSLISALALSFASFIPTANAADNPTCVLMKFTDDTRFAKIESAASLSDLVMEKLLASGKINFRETDYIDTDMEFLLYEERALEFKAAEEAAFWDDNFSVLFEGEGFNAKKAQTIATAQVGQFISPEITSEIGRQHGAEYLIQGTILNLGTGNWMDMDLKQVANYAQTASTLASYFGLAGGLASALGPVGLLASAAGEFEMRVAGVAVQADLRLIKAETGEVVWQKMVTGKDTKKEYRMGILSMGSDKLSNEVYADAMDNAADAIADAIIEDIDAGKLFVD